MGKLSHGVLGGTSFAEIKKGSVSLDGTKWRELPFVERNALHYQAEEMAREAG